MPDLKYKTVARYLLGGGPTPTEEQWVDLDAYDQYEAATKAPEGTYAFQIFQQPLPPEGMSEEEAAAAIYGQAAQVSSTYYLGGQVHTLQGVERRPRMANLAQNMKALRINFVIHTCNGGWEPFEQGDVILTNLEETDE